MINYIHNKTIWMFWVGDNIMSPNRQKSYTLFCQINKNCNVTLIKDDDVKSLQNIHEGYQYLSAIQKSDYLKVYFMHHFGGGYSDIKATQASWEPYFIQLEKSDKYGIGYSERSIDGVARIENCQLNPSQSKYCRDFTLDNNNCWSSTHIRTNWKKLIGNGSFIFKPHTDLTYQWWNGLNEKMDGYLPELKKHPQQWNRDAYGHIIPATGQKSQYPIKWAVIGGNILHPLSLKYHHKINQNLPYHSMIDYR